MPEYDIAKELAKLHSLKRFEFVLQLRKLAHLNIFKPVEKEKNIFIADASHHEDIVSLMDAARKAVYGSPAKPCVLVIPRAA